jgi:hypothetical protein
MHNTFPLSAKSLNGIVIRETAVPASRQTDYAIVAGIVAFLALISITWSRPTFHWFLLPAMACGVLAGVDIVRWLRGRLDLFDPKTIIGCLAFYGFFIAPILHVAWDRFGVENEMAMFGDWRTWLGGMAALNALGLLTYRLAHNQAFSRAAPSRTSWRIDRKKFYPIFALALAVSVAGVGTYLWQLGGISGVVEAYEKNQEAFVGKGWLLVFAWPLAVLSFIVVVFSRMNSGGKRRYRLSMAMILMSIAGLGHFCLLGWYGSRCATVWALFWMSGIIHYCFRKLPTKLVAIGAIFLIAFMYFYGFYKEQKRASLEILSSPAMWLAPGGYERDLKYLLLGDLARADSNAFILHNLIKDPGDYDYRWGLTYAGGLAILIPAELWHNRPYVTVEAGAEALFGKTAYWPSSRVYGLSGEALLNFGVWGVPFAFGILGWSLGWYRRKFGSWDPTDARMFLAPFFSLLFLIALIGDSDNLVFAAVTQGALIVTAVFAASDRRPAAREDHSVESIGYA